MATGTESRHTPTRGGVEAAKEGGREVWRKEEGQRVREKGGGSHLVLCVHVQIHELEKRTADKRRRRRRSASKRGGHRLQVQTEVQSSSESF